MLLLTITIAIIIKCFSVITDHKDLHKFNASFYKLYKYMYKNPHSVPNLVCDLDPGSPSPPIKIALNIVVTLTRVVKLSFHKEKK